MVAPPPKTPLDSLRVLVVDDDVRLLELIRSILKVFGFVDVRAAMNAKQGWVNYIKDAPHFMICDWEMKGKSGLDLVHDIRYREDSPNPTMPVIMLTGRSEVRDVMKARDGGVTEYLAKPFTVEGLRERIISIIERPRAFVLADNYKGPDRRRKRKLPNVDYGEKEK